LVFNEGQEFLTIIGFVGNDGAGAAASEQRLGLRNSLLPSPVLIVDSP